MHFKKTTVKSRPFRNVYMGLLVGVNVTLYLCSAHIDYPDIQKREDASGFAHDKAQHFVYFYYYLNHFPLTTENTNLEYSKEAANQQITDHGDELLMEYEHWSRLGENARIWAYLPDAYLRGSPEHPRITLFNSLFYTISLICVFLGFRRANLPFLGFVLSLIMLLTPFFMFEVYTNQNIFALLPCLFLMTLGVHLKLLLTRNVSLAKYFISALVFGSLIGVLTQMRGEVKIVLVTAILLFLVSKVKVWQRLALCFVITLAYWGSNKAVFNYFESEFQETLQLVEAAGGHPYYGKRIEGHRLWHPIFCGLGDFGSDKGYTWRDYNAYNYAAPILKDKYGIDITDKFHDSAGKYYIRYDEIDEYEQIVKDKVLSDIKSDPLWYASILVKRLGAILSTTLPFPYAGWLIFPVMYVLFRRKNWLLLKVLLISLPLSATSLLIHSGKNATYNGMYSILTVAIGVYLLVECWAERKRAVK